MNFEKSFPKIFEKSKERSSTKNRLISYSLMWMGLGVAIIFLMTYLVISVPQIGELVSRIANSSSGWTILLVVNMVLIISLSFSMHKMNIASLVLLYIAFVFVEGFFVSTTLYYSGFDTQVEGFKNVFLLFLIPSAIFILMGMLGYFQVFDFSKIAPFLIFATIGLMIFSVFLIFFGGESTQKWYSLLGIIIFSLWIGFDIWWIQRTSDQIEAAGGIENDQLVRIGLMFGLRLFIDFVNILMYVARLLR
ncbi:MAG: Bax inhibitor-1/YccA family protein [Metamycoplasmataceae bacterium]